MSSHLPRVTVISLGGTISSARAAGSRLASPRLAGADLVAAVPELVSLASIDVVDLARLPSNDLSFALAMQLADEIAKAFHGGADGVVVTQGTDTIEEMSFFLDLTVTSDLPVVVTGAMRHAEVVGSDGAANLLQAVRVAAAPHGRGLGALVVLNDEIHSALTVRKAHTTALQAFCSPDVGPLGWVAEDVVYLRDRPYPRVVITLPPDAQVRPVPMVTAAFDDDGWWLAGVAANSAQGLVVEGLGGGHVPGRVFNALIGLADRIPVLLTSRTGHGVVLTSTYGGFRGSETTLIEGGLIPAGTLYSSKARVLLSVALAAGWHRDQIAESVQRLGRLSRTTDT